MNTPSPPLKNPVPAHVHAKACASRLQRVRAQLQVANCDAILLYDPVNIRYATDTSNMQIWTMHNRFRYVLLVAGGPVILWEFHNCAHLHEGNPQLDEIRDAISWAYFGAGPRAGERALKWASDLAAVIRQHAGRGARLAIDSDAFGSSRLLEDRGLKICDGESIMQEARKIKCANELEIMRWTMRVCEAGIQRMHDELRPGMSEQGLWALLHYENIRHGGEWIETRLLVSGPRTNPWMLEASDRVMQEGELVCFDTDLIGPYGYCADVSRAWTVGHVAPTDRQRELYRLAHEQIEFNAALIAAGKTYREVSEKAWPIPERFYRNRYSYLLHGVGMGDEYPGIAHAGDDWDTFGHDGRFEANMVVSVESYIGEHGEEEGVKLEQQYLVTESGVEPFCNYPWNEHWL